MCFLRFHGQNPQGELLLVIGGYEHRACQGVENEIICFKSVCYFYL